LRVSPERVFELARHLTERDRAIALALYEHQLLTTEQLRLLFFSSRRRAQDRLRFLYEQRVLDRFYPTRPYGLGKPQAHWLLDEAGATLVAASLGMERKQLGWQRRDDWGSHPQLLHRLEANRFVTHLIATTLAEESLGVSEWSGSRSAHALLRSASQGTPIPDCGFFLETPGGPNRVLPRMGPRHRDARAPHRQAEALLARGDPPRPRARRRERAVHRSDRAPPRSACHRRRR
jgi:hypothetical protein